MSSLSPNASDRREQLPPDAPPVTREDLPALPGAAASPAEVVHLESYGPDLLRRAAMLTRWDTSRAADLVQDTMERALRHVHRLAPGSNVRAWLYTIMVRRFRDTLRHERVRRTESRDSWEDTADDGTDSPPPWTAITTEEVRVALA